MTSMSDSTRRAREIEKAVRLASERYRARRAGIDAVESKANVWFGGGSGRDGGRRRRLYRRRQSFELAAIAELLEAEAHPTFDGAHR